MQTRLPRALAALGVALLLSSIEAEGKMLLLPSRQVTLPNSRKEKTHLLLLLLALFPLHFSGGFSFSEKRPPSEVCPFLSFQVQLFYPDSPLAYSAVWFPRTCLCSVLSTLPPTVPTSWRTSPLDRATAASISTRRMPAQRRLGTRNLSTWTFSQDHQQITWVATVILVTTRNKRLQHCQPGASGFPFLSF